MSVVLIFPEGIKVYDKYRIKSIRFSGNEEVEIELEKKVEEKHPIDELIEFEKKHGSLPLLIS